MYHQTTRNMFKFEIGQTVMQRIGDNVECVEILDRAIINGSAYYKSDGWARFIPENYFWK